MDWLKKMSLKKAFFTLTFLFLIAAVILIVIQINITGYLRNCLDPNSIMIEIGETNSVEIKEPKLEKEGSLQNITRVISWLDLILPIVFIILALILADILFYRIKLKKPLSELKEGAENIMQNNLDFSIEAHSDDELGHLSTAFESMRKELLHNNQELWRQSEERKRLNAAFSHDLRNPVTVLKGSIKILQKGIQKESLIPNGMVESLNLMEEYTGRIETYVEAMSRAVRLEDIPCIPQNIRWDTLIREISQSIRLLAIETTIDIEETQKKYSGEVWIDKAIFFNTAENLIANAARYALHKIHVSISITEGQIYLSVQDDGKGFSPKILKKGAEPFMRGEENDQEQIHFGMGLYICSLLCKKHGGCLVLENNEWGALATASFKNLKP